MADRCGRSISGGNENLPNRIPPADVSIAGAGELLQGLCCRTRKRALLMTEHFTRKTISAAFPCAKCKKFTQHRIDDGRKGPCLECIKNLEVLHEAGATPPLSGSGERGAARQGRLFDVSEIT
jgi:hypothetical protein